MRHLPVLPVLALTQITGWGAVGLLPVLAGPIATAYGASLPSVFLGSSLMFVAMALAAPIVGRGFRHFSPRGIMAAGAAGIGAGLSALSLAPGLAAFWAAWVAIGVAGAMFLTTPAYAFLASHAGGDARRPIGILMLVTGLAGSLFWPLFALLEPVAGWRGTVLAAGLVMLVLVCPLVRFGLPRTEPERQATDRAAGQRGQPLRGPAFALMLAAISLNSFVTFGIEAIGIVLLQAMGADLAEAVLVASLLGVAKVGGRLLDLLGAGGRDGLATGLVAGAMIPLGLAALSAGGAGFWGVGGYLLLFGIGSGAFAVARATMPLVFWQRAEYAAAISVIALPMNLINALAPPALAVLLSGLGVEGVLALLAGLSVAAFAALLALERLRQRGARG